MLLRCGVCFGQKIGVSRLKMSSRHLPWALRTCEKHAKKTRARTKLMPFHWTAEKRGQGNTHTHTAAKPRTREQDKVISNKRLNTNTPSEKSTNHRTWLTTRCSEQRASIDDDDRSNNSNNNNNHPPPTSLGRRATSTTIPLPFLLLLFPLRVLQWRQDHAAKGGGYGSFGGRFQHPGQVGIRRLSKLKLKVKVEISFGFWSDFCGSKHDFCC